MERQEKVAVRIPRVKHIVAFGGLEVSLLFFTADRRNAERNIERPEYCVVPDQVQFALFFLDDNLVGHGKIAGWRNRRHRNQTNQDQYLTTGSENGRMLSQTILAGSHLGSNPH
jgi:hypothetical protein